MNRWFAEQYGSRRGFILTWWHRALYMLGNYRKYRQVNWTSVTRLVFVCKGNICRSAYAEGVARLLGFESISCGIDTVSGAMANEEAIRTAAQKGIDLKKHRTTPLESSILKSGDLLIAMEPWQAELLEQQFGENYNCTLLGLWGKAMLPHIHDPFGASSPYFDICFDYIESSVNGIVRKIN
jgi:protein-tyrosine phosphatase